MIEIPKKEALNVEFKSDPKPNGYPDESLIEDIVGITNTEGGDLYLGVDDDGTPSGVLNKHKDPIGLMALISNNTRPIVSVRAEQLQLEGHTVIRISIPKSDSVIATAKGKVLRRRLKDDGSPETIPMYPYEIPTRLSTLGRLDFSKQPVTDATPDDIDKNQMERLRGIIRNRNGEKVLLELSDEELAKALGFFTSVGDKAVPTLTGLLMAGKEDSIRRLVPTMESVFQVLQGTSVAINESFFRPIPETVELFNDYMKAWNPEKEMEYGLFRIPVPEFSHRAFREGLINAFAHRDYSRLGSVRVQISNEGLTISNPGGFIDGITLDNLLDAEPRGRNPSLSDALKRIGLAERTGRGIDRIFEGSISFGRPWPDYSASNSDNVILFIPRAKADLPFIKMISDEQSRRGSPLSINALLVLSAVKMERKADFNHLEELTHISKAKLSPIIEDLIESGLVEEQASGRKKVFMLSRTVYLASGKIKEYVRQKGIDRIRYQEMIMKFAKERGGYITKQDVTELLHISDSQAYQLLRLLQKEGHLELAFSGRYARYRLIN